MIVEFIHPWFSPGESGLNKDGLFRSGHLYRIGEYEVPDEFAEILPKDVNIKQGPEGVEVKASKGRPSNKE